MRHEAFDLGSIDIRSLNPAQREALQRRLTGQADTARTRALQRSFVPVFMLLRRLRPAFRVQATRNAVGKVWIALIRRRERLQGLASLRAMTDYELRDIGISRSEIGGAAFFSEESNATPHDRRRL